MQGTRGLSGSTLKITAMLSMLTDHIACVFLEPVLTNTSLATDSYTMAYMIMRMVIGRLAFPIYCFLLVEGFQKTHSRKKYAFRLFLFSLFSELPFDLAFYGTPFEAEHCNVFVTLFLSFIMMCLMEEAKKHFKNLWLVMGTYMAVFLAAAVSAELIHCDYGAKGILAVALLYLFRQNKAGQLIAGCVAFLWETTAPLAFIPIAFYNGRRGLKLKYVFYVFYPAHLLLLYLICQLIR